MTALMTGAVLAFVWGLSPESLVLKAADAQEPTELLQTTPFDRLTLIDNSVMKVEPVSPRPLPEYDPLKKKKPERSRGLGNIFLKGGQSKDEPEAKEDDEPADRVIIHLMEGAQRDFTVKRGSIKSVEYWEDMLLAEGEKQVLRRNFPKAFEYYLAVEARNPNWKGLKEHVETLLFEEGTWALASNERDRGIRLLRELNERRPDYPGLAEKLANAYANRIEEAINKGAFGFGRKILHELEKISPDNPLASELQRRFIQRAEDLTQRAQKTSGFERLDLLTQALRIWPKYEPATQQFPEAFRDAPTLDVGVIDVPRPVAPWRNSTASRRVSPLLYLPILADDSEDALRGKSTSGQLASEVILGDLGRRIDLTLRRGLRWSDGSRQVSAIDVVRALSDRAQPRSPAYNARWADLLDRIETIDIDRLTVRLTRPTLKAASWLLEPIGPAHASWDGRVSTSDGRLPVGDGPYSFASGTNEQTTYLLSDLSAESGSASSESASPKIQRIREIRLPDAASAMGAFVRGEVTLIEHVPPDRVEAIRRNEDMKVGRYRLPAVHYLAVDGRNPVLMNRSLRRGISYAIDRKTLLEETLLRRPIDEVNRPADGPFSVESYANAADVPPLEHKPLLARMLIAAAKKEMVLNRIRLTLEFPAMPEAQASVSKMAEALRGAGLEIDLVERSASELEQALQSGRKFDLAYRVSRCVEPVWEAGPILCPGYDAPPATDGLAALASPRMMQLLLQLEHATEWTSARELVTQIDRECRDEFPIIPLWQLQEHFAWRTRMKGPADESSHLYQGIERWEIEPWFATDPW